MKRLMFLLTLTVFSIIINGTTHAATIVTDGLVSYWTFDLHNIKEGIAEDVWGENDAMIMGNPEVTEGYLKQGLKFDGLGDYVILDNIGNVQSHTGPSTFEFWVKTSYPKRNTLFKVIEKLCKGDEIGDDRGWGIHLNVSLKPPDFNNPPPFLFQEGEEGIIDKDGYILIERKNVMVRMCSHGRSSRGASISDDKWHHIVYMYNSEINEFRIGSIQNVLYVDTKRIVSGSGSSSDPIRYIPHTQPVFLGAINDNGKPKRYFRGVFDEVRVYDRMLTEEEILRNYNSGVGLSVEPTQKLPTVWGALKARH